MGADIGLVVRVLFVLVFAAVNAERLFFVDVGTADGDGDGKDGDVHHDEVGDLNGGVECREVDIGETCCSGRGSLKPAIENSNARRQDRDDWVFELEELSVGRVFCGYGEKNLHRE